MMFPSVNRLTANRLTAVSVRRDLGAARQVTTCSPSRGRHPWSPEPVGGAPEQQHGVRWDGPGVTGLDMVGGPVSRELSIRGVEDERPLVAPLLVRKDPVEGLI